MRVQRQWGIGGRGAGLMRGGGDLTQPPSNFSKFLVGSRFTGDNFEFQSATTQLRKENVKNKTRR